MNFPLQPIVENVTALRRPHVISAVYAIIASYTVFKLAQVVRRRLKTTALRGPPNPSLIWGITKDLLNGSPDLDLQYEDWAGEYGGAYEIPWTLGARKIVLCDPKAIAHVFGHEPWTYVLIPFGQIATEQFVGKGILTATGESHRRQRRTLSPAFSTAAIRNLTTVFYDSAYKAKDIWDGLIESSGNNDTLIDVQNWMNRLSIDIMGIACFSHDFRSLDGKPNLVAEGLAKLGGSGELAHKLFIVLAETFPWMILLPTSHIKIVAEINKKVGEIANALLTKSRKEKEAGASEKREEKSILGLLVSAEDGERQLRLSPEEVMAQARVILIAGYETTSISMTWALIELAKHPDVQSRLRAELLALGADPTFDQLSMHLPYLDAVVHETLRLHAPVPHFNRMATEDDVIPLGMPVRTRDGRLVDHVSVAKGTFLLISVPSVNRSTALWGSDAKEFKPERWTEEGGIPSGAKEIQGHRHLLTFIDGPRACLGKGFALTEFKIVLSVLIKHFVFELRDGPETRIETMICLLPRPKLAGEAGTAFPLRVRRFE